MSTDTKQPSDSGLDPHARAFLEQLKKAGGPALETLPPSEARGVLRSVQAGKTAKKPARIEDRSLPVGPDGQVSVRIVRPADVSEKLPVVLYLHGGGWVLGDKDTHDRLIRELAVGTRCAVVFVNYTPAPEGQYPAQLEQAYAALQWVAKNGGEADLDGQRIAVVGDSAGGNLAAALTLVAKERGGPRILQQVLFYPVMDARFDTGSYARYADGYFLTRAGMQWFWDNYAPDSSVRTQPTVSPLRATDAQLRGLPPALILNGECDVLRDEGQAYARRLVDAGVPALALQYEGMIHDFVMLDPLADSLAARNAIAQACLTLSEVLGTRKQGEAALTSQPAQVRERENARH
ncbi:MULTISPECIES: alpha/beta hydrolase [unclassified Corallococcus]|uniref:alpha/beta hydrolase n=1 Tax=unclassified Corallococcus TaxID=2685029 RepID=UPI001A90C718|nr:MULTISPECIES: alpha/beta hydrolase [unclassified Corallococcus]MBN9684764.1 alpha/beta hydrolase [Corallococcus sp. NCSPR001]WAS83766.1 alpha/beta hydrolase [Corallococcus sp. NCRR]